MASQSAQRTISVHPTSTEGTVEVEMELTCGCIIKRVLDDNRWLELADGTRVVVGKYPCPVDHPVMRPSR